VTTPEKANNLGMQSVFDSDSDSDFDFDFDFDEMNTQSTFAKNFGLSRTCMKC